MSGSDSSGAKASRVAVTRDEGADGELSRALRARGLDPVPCAATITGASPEPERLAAAARHLARYDWLIVASRRAVEALFAARDGASRTDGGRDGAASAPPALRSAAVGPRTAAALAAHGLHAAFIAPHAGGRALALALREADRWPGRRCLLPRALEGGRELAGALLEWGAIVDEIVAYQTIARPPAEIAAAWGASPDAAVIASPSAARALHAAIGAEPLRALRALVAIGPTTREALADLGLAALLPTRPDFESAAECVALALANVPFHAREIRS
jgi:uroporphyrinogen III methyltransferase/synthase